MGLSSITTLENYYIFTVLEVFKKWLLSVSNMMIWTKIGMYAYITIIRILEYKPWVCHAPSLLTICLKIMFDVSKNK